MFTSILFYVLTGLTTGDDTKSVLVPTPAPTPAVATSAPTPATQPEFICVNGKCRRVTAVEEQTYELNRRRLFGGQVTRSGARTVYKTSRR